MRLAPFVVAVLCTSCDFSVSDPRIAVAVYQEIRQPTESGGNLSCPVFCAGAVELEAPPVAQGCVRDQVCDLVAGDSTLIVTAGLGGVEAAAQRTIASPKVEVFVDDEPYELMIRPMGASSSADEERTSTSHLFRGRHTLKHGRGGQLRAVATSSAADAADGSINRLSWETEEVPVASSDVSVTVSGCSDARICFAGSGEVRVDVESTSDSSSASILQVFRGLVVGEAPVPVTLLSDGIRKRGSVNLSVPDGDGQWEIVAVVGNAERSPAVLLTVQESELVFEGNGCGVGECIAGAGTLDVVATLPEDDENEAITIKQTINGQALTDKSLGVLEGSPRSVATTLIAPTTAGTWRVQAVVGDMVSGVVTRTVEEAPFVLEVGTCPLPGCAAGSGSLPTSVVTGNAEATHVVFSHRIDGSPAGIAIRSEPLVASGALKVWDGNVKVPEVDGDWTIEARLTPSTGTAFAERLVIPQRDPIVTISDDLGVVDPAVLNAFDMDQAPPSRVAGEPEGSCRTFAVVVEAATPPPDRTLTVTVDSGSLDGGGRSVELIVDEASPHRGVVQWLVDEDARDLATVTVQGDGLRDRSAVLALEPVLPVAAPGFVVATASSLEVGAMGSTTAQITGQVVLAAGTSLDGAREAHVVVDFVDSGAELACARAPESAVQCDAFDADPAVPSGGCLITNESTSLDVDGRFSFLVESGCLAGTATISVYTERQSESEECLGEGVTSYDQVGLPVVLEFVPASTEE